MVLGYRQDVRYVANGSIDSRSGREKQYHRNILHRKTLMRMTNFVVAMVAMLVGGPLAWEFFDRNPPFAIVTGVTVPPEIQRGKEFHIDWTVVPNPRTHCPG